MKKFAVGLITTMLLAVVIGGGVILANDGKGKIKESVSLSGRAFPGGGCDGGHTCFLSGFSQVVEDLEDDLTRVLGIVQLTSVPRFGSEFDNAVTISVASIVISEEPGGKVATLRGGVRGVVGDWPIVSGFGIVIIEVDEAAQTIDLIIGTDNPEVTKDFFFGGFHIPSGIPFAFVDISQ